MMQKKDHSRHKIAIINVYFGVWPKWFPLFIQSCIANPEFDFFLFSDNPHQTSPARNVHKVFFPREKFMQIAAKKLGFAINIEDPVKICDFKPAFGKIFEDFLNHYDFWGFTDIDLIYGKLSSRINDSLLHHYDVICGYKDYISGPFCILRNKPNINRLYTLGANYKNILKDPMLRQYDEHIIKPENKGFSIKKLFFILYYSVIQLLRFNWKIFRPKTLKYYFQWFYKKNTITTPVDFTEAVIREQQKNRLKVFFHNFISSDSAFNRKGEKNWIIQYNRGSLTDKTTNRDFVLFHFKDSKQKKGYRVFDHGIDPEQFLITPLGFFKE